jgi:hypothetical protein
MRLFLPTITIVLLQQQASAYFYSPLKLHSTPDVYLDHIIHRESIGEQLNNTIESQNDTSNPNRVRFIDDYMISDSIKLDEVGGSPQIYFLLA